MNKKLLITTAIVAIIVPLCLIVFFIIFYPQIRLKYYQNQADAIITQVTQGEIEYLEASRIFEDRGCDRRGYGCVVLEANRVLDTDTRYTLFVDLYECSKDGPADNWNCFRH